MRILVAVDESENSHRAVQYVGALLRRTPDVAVTLFHVLKPMPRELLEHGGSENPAAEAKLGYAVTFGSRILAANGARIRMLSARTAWKRFDELWI